MADALDLGSNGEILGGSSPPLPRRIFRMGNPWGFTAKQCRFAGNPLRAQEISPKQKGWSALKVAVKDVAPCEKLLSVDVQADAIREQYELVYREIAKVAKIPGFRPGKAPRDVISVHYKNEAREEVIKKLVSKTLHEALEEKKLEPILHPEIKDVDFTENKLSYKAHIEIRPEVKISTYAGIKVKKNPIKVEAAEIDQVIDRLREGFAKFIPVEDRGLDYGDFMIADLKVIVDSKEIESREDDWIEFKEKTFLPEFAATLKGTKAGEAKDVEVNFPADYAGKEVAGKKGLFKIKLKEIKKRMLPDVDADFIKEVGEYKSIDELRQAVRSDLEAEKESQEEHRLQNEILESLVKSSQFSLPKKMVERRLEHLVGQALNNMMYQGMKQEEALKEKDKVREKLKAEAEKQVRLSFILDEIATREKMEVTEKDLEQKFEDIAKEVKQPKEKVVEYYAKEHLIENLAVQILNQKTARFLREKAEIIQ